ncbi:MAG: hypothetical protein JWL57_518 [Actinobacteria bacterium]|nr:hypothetical protein [Actinomycetota bacterium]
MRPKHIFRNALRRGSLISAFAAMAALVAQSGAVAGLSDIPSPPQLPLLPGALLVSSSVFQNDPNIVAGSTQLPPGCTGSTCVTATAGGSYPYVFNNALVDASFGITSKIVLNELTPWGFKLGSIDVPNSSQPGISAGADQMVTSFPSKSEIGLNLSTDGQYLTFMGYRAPVGTLDASNSNTPGAIDPTNPVPSAYYRVVAELGRDGKFHFTETNAYSGNNGRAAILNNKSGANFLYMAGNAGNGANPQPAGIVEGAGAQIAQPSLQPEALQNPGTPTPVGSFNITQLGDKADKIGKDDNFRGIGVHNNVLYYTKGSGGNGVDTVYFVDTTGNACPNGVGLPQPGATLPTSPVAYNASTVTTTGLPSNMCILAGFPTTLAKAAPTMFPFGVWFANPTTLYVADEGTGSNTYSSSSGQYTDAAASTTAGLQKWVFDATAGMWKLAYTLQSGLNLGQPYTVPGYPTGNNAATGLPWAPATDGLRNLTGRVNPDGTVTIWAMSSTVSGGGDQGADPNRLVAITDRTAAGTLPAGESFKTLQTSAAGSVLRGVSFTPGTCPALAGGFCFP